MTKDELLAFLRDNLKITLDSTYDDAWNGNHIRTTVTLLLGTEEISTATEATFLPSNR